MGNPSDLRNHLTNTILAAEHHCCFKSSEGEGNRIEVTMTEKKMEGVAETEDPVLSRIGNFGKFQARASPLIPHSDKWNTVHI